MKRLDRSGLFGIKEDRKNVVINVETAPPDGSEYNRALRLNPSSESIFSIQFHCILIPFSHMQNNLVRIESDRLNFQIFSHFVKTFIIYFHIFIP
ncbi:MAG: DUF4303 domain-containing protein, partial [Acetatifactor sp.]|nr:DUF4303 domain-containing protein [Acetatifactor sp.]